MLELICLVVGEIVPLVFEVNEGIRVGVLHNIIMSAKKNTITCDVNDLQLYRAFQKNEWLSDKITKETDVQFFINPENLMRSTRKLSFYFNEKELTLLDGKIHVLVVVPGGLKGIKDIILEEALGEDDTLTQPPRKKHRSILKSIAYTGPIRGDHYSVPLETIEAFERIKNGFELSTSINHPLFLLFGPRQFGKSTIALGIYDWVVNRPNVKAVFIELHESDVRDEKVFWFNLGKQIDKRIQCDNQLLFRQLVHKYTDQDGMQLCLIVDRMHLIFSNPVLAEDFFLALREWRLKPHFLGFLGVGSHQLVHHYAIFRNSNSIPFNVCDLVNVEPFSIDQMSSYFKLIEHRFPFTESLRIGIMEYSRGAPGVFGSIIRFLIDHEKVRIEYHEWELWFKIQNFSLYLMQFNNTYQWIRSNLHTLSKNEWEALKFVLENNGEFSSTDVERHFNISNHENLIAEKLLNVGIVMEDSCGKLAIVSEAMRQVCVEELPIREVRDVVYSENPLEILLAALRNICPKTLSHHLVRNKLGHSEAVFQHELYATIRGILKLAGTSRGAFPEAKTTGREKRADIVISNGKRIAFELKVNCLTTSQLDTAAKQASTYKASFDVESIIIVNFVPLGHKLDTQYRFSSFTDISIVHVWFSLLCQQFSLEYVDGNGQVQKRIIEVIVS